jgi:hypothetical protein
MFTIPMFIAYGLIARGYDLDNPRSLLYYPWLILMFLLISSIPVLFAALLSIPAMFINIFLNRVKVLQYLLYIALGGGAILLLWWLIGLIPEDINFIESWGNTYWKIQAFLEGYTENFSLVYHFTELIVGRTVGSSNVIFHSGTLSSLLLLFGIGGGLLLLCFLCSKPLFYRMASTPFEFKKKDKNQWRSNRKSTPFFSAVKKEFVVGLRSNSFVKLGGVLIVAMPMAIYLLNKLYSAMDTRFIGTQMTVCFNIVIILLIMLMTNIDIASIYSRDGSSAYLNKVQPTPYVTLLISKLLFPAVIALIGLIFTVNIFAIEAELAKNDAILIGTMIYGVYVAHLFSSAENDIMNPQYEQYATFNDQANNPNETGAGVSAIIMSAAVFAIAFFLSSRNDAGVWLKLAIVGALFAAFKVFTYFSKIKAFYKEKQ